MQNNERLPFTDENLEDEFYKNECDKLATLEVQDCYTSWGRWFLDDGMLSTWVVAPQTERLAVRKLFVYGLMVENCLTENGRNRILENMQTKDWLGDRGIKDLKRALKYLAKHCNKNINELE